MDKGGGPLFFVLAYEDPLTSLRTLGPFTARVGPSRRYSSTEEDSTLTGRLTKREDPPSGQRLSRSGLGIRPALSLAIRAWAPADLCPSVFLHVLVSMLALPEQEAIAKQRSHAT